MKQMKNGTEKKSHGIISERLQDRYHCKTPLEVRREAFSAEHPAEYKIPQNKRIEKYKEKWCA